MLNTAKTSITRREPIFLEKRARRIVELLAVLSHCPACFLERQLAIRSRRFTTPSGDWVCVAACASSRRRFVPAAATKPFCPGAPHDFWKGLFRFPAVASQSHAAFRFSLASYGRRPRRFFLSVGTKDNSLQPHGEEGRRQMDARWGLHPRRGAATIGRNKTTCLGDFLSMRIKTMRAAIGGLVLVLVAAGSAFGQAPKATGKAGPAFRIGNDFYVAGVSEVKPDGQVTVMQTAGAPGRGDLAEGIYLGIAAKELPRESLKEASLVRVQVLDVLEGGAKVQVGKEAAKKLTVGGVMMLFRPRGATTAQLKAAPEIAPLTDAKVDAAGLKKGTMEELARSQNNLKMIGLAMHNFHDVYGAFPPAVVVGPDGKPWHSWRVLVLPFLEQQALYDQYRFDEPWNGPNNSKLLEKIPSVYRDPVHGEPMDYFTHYAAATGKGVAFSSEGAKFDGKTYTGGGGLRLHDFIDGTSNSLLIGSVSPARKIPWMKPEDVTVGEEFPAPGKPDKKGKETGFAAPYEAARGSAGVFLWADGSVQTILDSVPAETFRTVLTIGDGIPVDRSRIPTLDPSDSGRSTVPVIRIEQTKEGPLARITQEEGEPEPLELAPPPAAPRPRPR
jgi:hypothetical protein